MVLTNSLKYDIIIIVKTFNKRGGKTMNNNIFEDGKFFVGANY